MTVRAGPVLSGGIAAEAFFLEPLLKLTSHRWHVPGVAELEYSGNGRLL